MKTGTCFLSSWAAIVWPTMAGKIVEVRDQVFTICFLPASFIEVIRPIRRSSTHGPFFVERPISNDPFQRGAPQPSETQAGRGRRAQPLVEPKASPRTKIQRRFAAGGGVPW